VRDVQVKAHRCDPKIIAPGWRVASRGRPDRVKKRAPEGQPAAGGIKGAYPAK
jgi:hypothetical protein